MYRAGRGANQPLRYTRSTRVVGIGQGICPVVHTSDIRRWSLKTSEAPQERAIPVVARRSARQCALPIGWGSECGASV